MPDPQVLREPLMQVLEALERIPRRFKGIDEAEDFLNRDEGVDRLDAICTVLIAVGKRFRQIDRKAGGKRATIGWGMNCRISPRRFGATSAAGLAAVQADVSPISEKRAKSADHAIDGRRARFNRRFRSGGRTAGAESLRAIPFSRRSRCSPQGICLTVFSTSR